MDEQLIQSICEKFHIEGEYRSCELLPYGHINHTYLVSFYRNNDIKKYILQQINTFVFKNPAEIMDNISDVTEYIRAKIKACGKTAKRLVLHYQKADRSKYYIEDETGFWRCYRFIDNSVTFDTTDNPKVIEEAGRAFGEFQMYLADYPVEKLNIAIPHFHNTVNRYLNFDKAVSDDKSGRADSVRREIAAYKDLEEVATEMYRMQIKGELPLKVTHNDTKTNNVLFDKDTFSHLAVIDLDTVMPGLTGFDFGDAIRFIANTCNEDEKDISKVAVDMSKYEQFAKGFVSVVGETLSQNEKDTLVLGAITMTTECGLRFLTDYIDGDEYFRVDHPQHNLERARCQLALAQSMILHQNEMNDIIKKYCY